MILEATYDIQGKSKTRLRKLSMAVLAILPLLAWYAIPFPVGLGYAIVLFLSAYTIAVNNSRINIFPFWGIVFAYVCVMWIVHNDVAVWITQPPGGWSFFLFFMSLVWGILTFDLHSLKKYMRYVVFIAMAIFWLQVILMFVNGGINKYCFVPKLTDYFVYEEMSYAEIVQKHLNEDRPSSIFLEPSYMAYYYISYLALVWFDNTNKKIWLNREIFYVVITIIALRSGSGMVGLAVLIIVKFFIFLVNASVKKRLITFFIIFPIIIGSIYTYTASDMGQEMIARSDEFSTVGSSGYVRVVSGYLYFSQLNFYEQLIGIPNPKDRFGTFRNNGTIQLYANGFQTILLTLGYLGMILYVLFYTSLFRKVSLSSRMSIIILLVMSLLEINYLNCYMMLLTIIPCADYYYNYKRLKR